MQTVKSSSSPVQQATVVPIYASLVLVWALTPLAIVWSVEEIPVLWALIIRFVCALPLMAVLLVVLRIPVPTDKKALLSYFAGSLGLIVSQTFTYMAAAYLSSGMVALMFGFAPIVAGLIAFIVFHQRLRINQWLGMMVAIGGLAIISTAGQEARVSLLGLGLMVCAIVCYASSIFWVKHINAPVAPFAQAAGSIAISLLIGLCYVPFIWRSMPTELPGARTLIAIAYTVVVATVLGMFFYFNLVQKISATTLSLATVITPMLALFFGVVLNNEQFRISILFGSLVVISGLAVYFFHDLRSLAARPKAI